MPTSWKPQHGCTTSATRLAWSWRVTTGLHALDGARYLRDTYDADAMACRLVAHHSCAIVEAEERGLADALSLEFEPAPEELSSVLTY
jgi:hypothetical protein